MAGTGTAAETAAGTAAGVAASDAGTAAAASGVVTVGGSGYGAIAANVTRRVYGRNFSQSNYCWYLPSTLSVRNASYTITPLTSTKAALVPSQPSPGATNPLALLRLGPNNSRSGKQVIVDGLVLTGTVQPKSAANPLRPGHNYHGLSVYWGRRAKILNSTFIAAEWGDSNSPPGETFQIMGYHDVDTYISTVEVDGRTVAGTRVGGSPIGFNASTRPVVEDSYLHHSLVSSLTFSTAGGTPSMATATSSPTTRRVRIEHNANTKMAPGFRFTGINHEHVVGDITHILPKISIDWWEWTASHMFFGTWLPSARVHITIDPGEISGGHPNNQGCLTVAIPRLFNGRANGQRVTDVVVQDVSGRRLRAYIITGAQSKPMPVDRETHFIVNAA
ncbi:hypothetical protein [Subtercola boreus]|uniref:Uncharacterized protein n=1 Tax=Subtercola boreus TaxID=120213 RepID=A0A3E0WCT2_9MICO|nr:hypothetical protein [Subtercola boreus]RFA21165.1 hypothetical protein B7R24_07175 [Subtercola boreus]RFA21548.1 hypothetical protein B7R23_07120 [Subtercola boreus]RFA27518.1 hypothetical protein B7R25_07245 [Subtercola boreus]